MFRRSLQNQTFETLTRLPAHVQLTCHFLAAVWFQIHDEKNDATSFSLCTEGAIASGFLKRGDVTVMDNAAIHAFGHDKGIEEWLWTECGIIVPLSPTRSPELNPIELVWRMLVQRLKQFPLRVLREQCGSHSTAKAACHVLSNMTHCDVAKTHAHVNLV